MCLHLVKDSWLLNSDSRQLQFGTFLYYVCDDDEGDSDGESMRVSFTRKLVKEERLRLITIVITKLHVFMSHERDPC